MNNSHKNIYKFVTILKQTNLDRLDDIQEFSSGKRQYKMDDKYFGRIETLKHLVKTYPTRKTNKEKLNYVDAIVSVQMWEYVDDPDQLDDPSSYQP